MRRIIAQARKELTQLLRDPLALGLALVLPVGLTALMGTTVSLTVTDIPIVIQDFDQTPLSRRYADAFRTSLTYRVVTLPPATSPETMLARGRARAAVIIPEHFEREIRRHRPVEAQVLVDATDGNTAQLIRGSAGQITRAFARPLGGATVPAIQTATRLWFNPGREPRKFYGPGFLVLGLSIFPTVLAALAMSREGEQKTILQVYVSSISAHEFLLGKILAGMVIGFAQCVLLAGLMFTLFGLRFAGDPTPVIVGSVLFVFCVMSFGSLVGAAIPNQAAAVQAVALGGFLLSFLLSGFALDSTVKDLRLGIVDESRTAESRELISVLTQSPTFRLAGSFATADTLGRELGIGRLDVGVVVPYDFARLRARGRPATVQVLLNAANANTAQIAQGYVEGAVAFLNRDLAGTRAAPVELRTALLYNPGLVNAWFIVTGVFGTLIILNGSLVSAATMIREKERGTC